MLRRGGRVTLNEALKILQRLTSHSGSPIYGPERSGDIKPSVADISAAKEHLGYGPNVGCEDPEERRLPDIEIRDHRHGLASPCLTCLNVERTSCVTIEPARSW